MFDVAVTYILDSHERVVLGEKLTGLGIGKIVAPGGKAKPGEDPQDTAAREIAEEVGLFVEPSDLSHVATIEYPFIGRPALSQRSFVFLTRSFVGDLRPSAELAASWWAVDEIPYERMWPDAALWLPQALTGSTLRARIDIGRDNEVLTHRLAWGSPA